MQDMRSQNSVQFPNSILENIVCKLLVSKTGAYINIMIFNSGFHSIRDPDSDVSDTLQLSYCTLFKFMDLCTQHLAH